MLIISFIVKVIKKDFEDWVQIINPFSFIFLNGSRELVLHITREGVRTGNWDIKPKLLPPKVQ